MAFQSSVKKTEMSDRLHFVYLWLSGLSLRFIANLTGASATTVRRWVRRWQRDGDLHAKTRRRKKCLLQTQTASSLLDNSANASNAAVNSYILKLISNMHSFNQFY